MNRYDTEVFVAGGGTAGMMAALAAAREGAGVILAERDFVLGGTGVRASVHHYYYGTLGGLQNEVDRRVRQQAQSFGGKVHGFHPEAKRAVWTEMVREAGITVITGAVVAEVLKEGNQVIGAILETDEGRTEIRAKLTLDCTGDGDVAYLAGAAYRLGREWDGALHAYSMIPRRVDERKVLRYTNFDAGWVDPTDPKDLSRGYLNGRHHAWKEGEDAANTHHLEMSAQIGIREGRYIEGEYVLRNEDLIMDRRFDDVIAHCFSHYDNHAYDYANESEEAQLWVSVFGLHALQYGGDIPYRCLIPKELDGLIVACRALSVERDAGMVLRMQRDMHKIGEAAGLAAAMCVQEGISPRHVDVQQLQNKLIAGGVLRREDLVRESRPWVTPGSAARTDRLWTLQLAQQPDRIHELIAHLGTEAKGKALWWLSKMESERVIPSLLKALEGAGNGQRRGIAFALALHGHEAGIAELVQVIRRKEADQDNGKSNRTSVRWVAALIVLKQVKSRAAFEAALALMEQDGSSTELLYLLQYFIAIADQLKAEERAALLDKIDKLVSKPGLGDDYRLWGNNTHGTQTGSMRWGIELTAGYLVERLGGRGKERISGYLSDSRGYARTAAERMLLRLNQKPGATSSSLRRRRTESPLDMGSYDAIVIGGGLAGCAAAVELAELGVKTALLEISGGLAWEIVRARHLQVPLLEMMSHVDKRGRLKHAITRRNGVFGERIDPVAASLAFDEWVTGAGVEVLFHCWPSKLLLNAERKTTGLSAASKSGYLHFGSPVVIDASWNGKIAKDVYGFDPCDSGTALHKLVFSDAQLDKPAVTTIRLSKDAICEVDLNGTHWPGEVEASVRFTTYPQEWAGDEAGLLTHYLFELSSRLRESISGLGDAFLTCVTDMAWSLPAFRIDSRNSGSVFSNRDIAEGLILAGPWLNRAPVEQTPSVAVRKLLQLAQSAALEAYGLDTNKAATI